MPQHALVVNPYNVAVQFTVEQAAVDPDSRTVEPNGQDEFLCVNCTVSFVTEKDDGSLVEVRHVLADGRRYRVVWISNRYELRGVAAK